MIVTDLPIVPTCIASDMVNSLHTLGAVRDDGTTCLAMVVNSEVVGVAGGAVDLVLHTGALCALSHETTTGLALLQGVTWGIAIDAFSAGTGVTVTLLALLDQLRTL